MTDTVSMPSIIELARNVIRSKKIPARQTISSLRPIVHELFINRGVVKVGRLQQEELAGLREHVLKLLFSLLE